MGHGAEGILLCSPVGLYLHLPGGMSRPMPLDLGFPVAHTWCDCLWNMGWSFFPMEMTLLGVAGASLIWCMY